MTMADLWASGGKDAFGYQFRDVWSVVGWEEGRVAEQFVCQLPARHEPPLNHPAPQLELFT